MSKLDWRLTKLWQHPLSTIYGLHATNFLRTTYPIRTINKENFSLPIPIGRWDLSD